MIVSKLKLLLALAGFTMATAGSAAADGVPALQITAPNGATSVLIGSLHVPAEGLRQPAASVMENAKSYLVEHVEEPPPTLRLDEDVLRGRAQRARWAQALTPAQVAQLERRVACQPGSSAVNAAEAVDAVLKLDSAQIAAYVAIARCASPGLLSRDEILKRAASTRGLVPVPLESATALKQHRDSVPEAIHVHQVYGSFTPASAEAFRTAVVALNAGSYESINAAVRGLAATAADADLYERIMLIDRNIAWMPVLVPHLLNGKAVVNVGASHLPGKQGLIALLRAKGFTVQPILLPAAAAS